MKTRQDILRYAKSLIGYTNYKMGAKWHSHNNNITRPKLLDCSGFVVWCYKMAGFNVSDGTYLQWKTSVPVSNSDLKIGDIGIVGEGGLGMYNHIGIYAGDGYWIHCNYGKNGVTLERTNIFKYTRRFKGIKFIDDTIDDIKNKNTINNSKTKGKEDNEMVTKGKFIINGKSYEFDVILKDDLRYVKIKDLAKTGLFEANYNNTTKTSILKNK